MRPAHIQVESSNEVDLGTEPALFIGLNTPDPVPKGSTVITPDTLASLVPA